MVYDPAWSQPLVNWQQQGSFVGPATPPSAGPLAGTLVQLPCINIDWLPLVLGALDQLRNPSSWLPTLTDAQLYDVLGDADTLRSAIGRALTAADPCVIALTDLTFANCTFTKHFSDGSTAAVVDWADAFCSCALGCGTPVPPPVGGGAPGTQRACNIAGFLATEVIQGSMQAVHDALAADQTVVEYAQAASQSFAAILPLTYYAVQAFVDWYNTASAQLLSDVQAVASDASLWSTVTCAIFGAIADVGYVDATNVAAVGTALGAISYPRAWVPGDLETFWNNMGLNNWENAQSVGAVDDVDCSACSLSWCKYFDFSEGPSGWELDPALPLGTYVAGFGWQSVVTSPLGDLELIVSIDVDPGIHITEIQIHYLKDHADSSVHPSDASTQSPAGTVTASSTFPGIGSWPGPSWASNPLVGFANRIAIDLISEGAGDPSHLALIGVQLRGTGVCPFTPPNDCIVGP